MQVSHVEPDSDPLSTAVSTPVQAATPQSHYQQQVPPTAEAPDPVKVFLGRPAPVNQLSQSSVPNTIEGVRTLGASGAWRAAASLSERLLTYSHPVDELLRLRWYLIVALLKMRDVAKAEREMAVLGDLRGTSWRYERYQAVYPGRTGPMVPFSLHLLHACLPSYGGRPDEALARLYALLASGSGGASSNDSGTVSSGAVARDAAPSNRSQRGSSGAPPPDTRLTDKEVVATVIALVNVLCTVQDYPNAVAHLEQLLGAMDGMALDSPGPSYEGKEKWGPTETCAQILGLLERVQLQLGNLVAAEDALKRLEAVADEPDSSAQVRIARGMLAMARSQYSAAYTEFTAACKIEPTSALAANNAAVSALYCERLGDAVATLEKFVKSDPRASMHEAIISNLIALYQMREGGNNAKATLESLVHSVAADDFDQSVLQFGQ